VFNARRSKFWLVMYSSACQRVQRLNAIADLGIARDRRDFGFMKCGTRCEIASRAMMVSASIPTKIPHR